MKNENQTLVTEFILLSLSPNPKTRIPLFLSFLCIYVLTICGNVILIWAVIASPRMHTPMYYLLCNLSFIDVFYSSASVPKILQAIIRAEGGIISFVGCMVQLHVSVILAETENFLLAVMAYDRYVAICFPLRYTVIISWRRCRNVIAVIWLCCSLSNLLPTIITPVTFCRKNRVNHFACELLSVLKLACGDTSRQQKVVFLTSFLAILAPFLFILITYTCIIRSILKIKSVTGRYKAFTTCSSHLTVVTMFYGTSMTIYSGQLRAFPECEKYISITYGVVTPMLNPLIYSLRNNDVKAAGRKIYCAISGQIHHF